MKEVFLVARATINDEGGFDLELLPGEHETYGDAVAEIPENTPGLYQVQKFFKKD